MKIKLYRTKDTASNPLTSLCPCGKRFSQVKNKYGDLCIMHSGIPLSKLFINSEILREALLDNPELVKEALGLEIVDLYAEEVIDEEEEFIEDDVIVVDPIVIDEEMVEEAVDQILEEEAIEDTDENREILTKELSEVATAVTEASADGEISEEEILIVEKEFDDVEEVIDLLAYSYQELKDLATEKGLEYPANPKKAILIKLIQEG